MHHETDVAWLKAQCANAESFADMFKIAKKECLKFERGARIGIVIGPTRKISREEAENNRQTLEIEATVRGLVAKGENIFNHLPYQKKLGTLLDTWMKVKKFGPDRRQDQYLTPVELEFFEPLFEKGLVEHGWFLPDWNSPHETFCHWANSILLRVGGVSDLRSREIEEFLRLEPA